MNSMHNSFGGSGGYSSPYSGYVPPPAPLPNYNGYPAELSQVYQQYYGKPGSVPPGYTSGMAGYSAAAAPPINNSMYYQQYGLSYQYGAYSKYGLGSGLASSLGGYSAELAGSSGIAPPSLGGLQAPTTDLGLTGSMFSSKSKYSGSQQGSPSPLAGILSHGNSSSILSPVTSTPPSPGPHNLPSGLSGPGATPSPPIDGGESKKEMDKMRRCQVCGQVFRLMSECLAHMKAVHEAPLSMYGLQHPGHVPQSMSSSSSGMVSGLPSNQRSGGVGAPDSPLMALERMGWGEKQGVLPPSLHSASSPLTPSYTPGPSGTPCPQQHSSSQHFSSQNTSGAQHQPTPSHLIPNSIPTSISTSSSGAIPTSLPTSLSSTHSISNNASTSSKQTMQRSSQSMPDSPSNESNSSSRAGQPTQPPNIHSGNYVMHPEASQARHYGSSPSIIPDNIHGTDTRSDVTAAPSSSLIKSRKTNSYSVSSIIGETNESNVNVNQEGSNKEATESLSGNSSSAIDDPYYQQQVDQKGTTEEDGFTHAVGHSKLREDSNNEEVLEPQPQIQQMVDQNSQQIPDTLIEQQPDIMKSESDLETASLKIESEAVTEEDKAQEITDAKEDKAQVVTDVIKGEESEQVKDEEDKVSTETGNEEEKDNQEQDLVTKHNDVPEEKSAIVQSYQEGESIQGQQISDEADPEHLHSSENKMPDNNTPSAEVKNDQSSSISNEVIPHESTENKVETEVLESDMAVHSQNQQDENVEKMESENEREASLTNELSSQGELESIKNDSSKQIQCNLTEQPSNIENSENLDERENQETNNSQALSPDTEERNNVMEDSNQSTPILSNNEISENNKANLEEDPDHSNSVNEPYQSMSPDSMNQQLHQKEHELQQEQAQQQLQHQLQQAQQQAAMASGQAWNPASPQQYGQRKSSPSGYQQSFQKSLQSSPHSAASPQQQMQYQQMKMEQQQQQKQLQQQQQQQQHQHMKRDQIQQQQQTQQQQGSGYTNWPGSASGSYGNTGTQYPYGYGGQTSVSGNKTSYHPIQNTYSPYSSTTAPYRADSPSRSSSSQSGYSNHWYGSGGPSRMDSKGNCYQWGSQGHPSSYPQSYGSYPYQPPNQQQQAQQKHQMQKLQQQQMASQQQSSHSPTMQQGSSVQQQLQLQQQQQPSPSTTQQQHHPGALSQSPVPRGMATMQQQQQQSQQSPASQQQQHHQALVSPRPHTPQQISHRPTTPQQQQNVSNKPIASHTTMQQLSQQTTHHGEELQQHSNTSQTQSHLSPPSPTQDVHGDERQHQQGMYDEDSGEGSSDSMRSSTTSAAPPKTRFYKVGPKSKTMAAKQYSQIDDLDNYRCTITVHENGSINGFGFQPSYPSAYKSSHLSYDSSENEMTTDESEPTFAQLRPVKRRRKSQHLEDTFIGPKRVKQAKIVRERQEKRNAILEEKLRQSEIEEQLSVSRIEKSQEVGPLGNILIQSSIILGDKELDQQQNLDHCTASIHAEHLSATDSENNADYGENGDKDYLLSGLDGNKKPGKKNNKVFHNENSITIKEIPAPHASASKKLRAKDFKWSHYIKATRYWCPDCAHGFKNQKEVENHSEELCKWNCLYMLECSVITKDIQTHASYGPKVQELLEEYQVDGDHECGTCGEVIAQRADYLVHVDSHKDFMPWECTICGTRFKIRGSLKEHLRYTHMKGRVPCLKCNKVFPTSTLLRQHVKVHTQHYKYKTAKNREEELKMAMEATKGALEDSAEPDEGEEEETSAEKLKQSHEANEYRNWCKVMEINAMKNIGAAGGTNTAASNADNNSPSSSANNSITNTYADSLTPPSSCTTPTTLTNNTSPTSHHKNKSS